MGFLGDSCITWSSRTQGSISHSPVESEIKAADAAIREVMHLRQLLAEIAPELAPQEPRLEGCAGATRLLRSPRGQGSGVNSRFVFWAWISFIFRALRVILGD